MIVLGLQGSPSDPWTLRVVDNTSRGADGVRPRDVNGDGRPDLVTGWEEGGVVRVYLHPGKAGVREAWPSVTVGRVKSPEDAVFFDVDGDGAVDVVSSCEGKTRTMFVHWAPPEKDRYLDPGAWKTEPLPESRGRMMWMFALPMQVDGKGAADLVAGGKGGGAKIGFFRAPAGRRRDLAAWSWQEITPMGWLMSILSDDVDGDGDLDLIVSDRKNGARMRGCRWLENPGTAGGAWRNHFMGAQDREIMFLSTADFDGDGRRDVLGAVRNGPITVLRRRDGKEPSWETLDVPLPDNIGTGKSVAAADLDGDGSLDLVLSCENARGEKSGIVRLSRGAGGSWVRHEISGPRGVKFDLVQLVDLDQDGDLDVLTCEERANLGVIWYENPSR